MTQLRVQAYLSLSQLLQRPDQDLIDHVTNESFKELWQQVTDAYGVQLPDSWVRNIPTLEECDKLWLKTMGPIDPLAEPIESLYKVWTTDPSCENPIANQLGYLKGDWGCHIEVLLNTVGFKIPKEFAHCPDHLVLEFEFFTYLIEEQPVEAQQTFAKHHFNWLKDLHQTSKEKNAPQLYQDLYMLCLQYVEADIASLAKA